MMAEVLKALRLGEGSDCRGLSQDLWGAGRVLLHLGAGSTLSKLFGVYDTCVHISVSFNKKPILNIAKRAYSTDSTACLPNIHFSFDKIVLILFMEQLSIF